MGNNFEDAREASENLFTDEQLSLDNTVQEPGQTATAQAGEQSQGTDEGAVNENTNTDTTPSASDTQSASASMFEDAAQTAETAAAAAAEKDAQLQQVLSELNTVKEQNSQLQGTIEELSRRNQENIIEQAMQPPTLDVNALAFADDETVKQAQAKYAADMAEYSRQQIMKELTPFVEQAKEGMYEKEKRSLISDLSHIPELNGIENMVPQLERIIKNNKALSSDDVPLDEKFITAYAIAKGVDSINTPPPQQKELSVDELMELYNNNSDFQNMVETQRLEKIKQSQQVPPLSGSSGAVNAALNIKEKPKTFDEASERTRQMFGLE